MYKVFLIFLISIFLLGNSSAQTTLTGVVKNNNGERLEFASVFLEETSHAAITDNNGEYILEEIPTGDYALKCTYLGYAPYKDSIRLESGTTKLDIVMEGDIYQLDKVEIISNRVKEDAAFTYKNVTQEEITKLNNGQDMPYLLRFTPSIIVTSDAGNGVGYTGIRIRGSDASRVNITVNGIPINDAESQGVFWVNMPDFASSVDNIQIQRGVGTSTSGAGAFGGTVSLNTQKTFLNPYAKVIAGYGSYNTKRLSLMLGSGLINDKYSVDFRYSTIGSDGYVDRATSELGSLYFTTSRVSANVSTRLVVFSGSERTYQSWWGVPEARMTGENGALLSHYYNNLGSIYETRQDSINLFSSDRRYNYYNYEDQVDDYGQTHVQLLDNRKISDHWVLNTAINYTHGEGYFEEYKVGESLADYKLPGDESDLIRRRWLNNDFYGGNVHLHSSELEKVQFTIGVSAFQYDGDHFGRVIKTIEPIEFTRGENYYFNEGDKRDLSSFVKGEFQAGDQWKLYGDLQYRSINYCIAGDDNDSVQLDVDAKFNFFNPKVGITFSPSDKDQLYVSYAVAGKEPNRSDFTDHPLSDPPQAEHLYDLELGYRRQASNHSFEVTLYNMSYDDQLILTGALNDVGSTLRANVPDSYRRGIEVVAGTKLNDRLNLGLSATFSQNKISNFTEVLYDYTDGFEIIENTYKDTDIAFSPSTIINGQLDYEVNNWWKVSWFHQYVGSQYLDNTSNDKRKLDAYGISDVIFSFSPELSFTQNLSLRASIRNLWNAEYAANGYTYSYYYGDLITENFYYPQAGRNFMLTMSMTFGK